MEPDLEQHDGMEIDFARIEQIGRLGRGLVPVVLQHADTHKVLFIGYTNRFALAETLETGSVVLWSTSRDQLWRKGATTGNQFQIVEVRVNCEQNSLLYLVRTSASEVCHTGRSSCFYRRLVDGHLIVIG